jgi:hypothetical protein
MDAGPRSISDHMGIGGEGLIVKRGAHIVARMGYDPHLYAYITGYCRASRHWSTFAMTGTRLPDGPSPES